MQFQSSVQAARMPQASGASCGGAHASLPPRSVTRGETHEGDEHARSSAALIDWLAFTVTPPAEERNVLAWIRDALILFFCVPGERWKSTGRGWNGYEHRVNLDEFGLLAHGGKHQRGTIHVELNAHACRRVQDWNAVRLWGETYAASITRVDLAHDDFTGDQVNILNALEWLKDGAFSSNGRPPAAQLIDDLGSNKGKTFYVGRRESGKFLRVYEKGKQLGDESSPWARVEVELRNKSRVVPWDALVRPGQYLAGAYPALGFLSAEQSRLQTTQRTGQISYAAMVKNLRAVGGKCLNVMSWVHAGDACEVLAQLVRDGVPKRLAGFSPQELREGVTA